MFDGENISFHASLVIYINSTNIPPIMIINRIYETRNILSLELVFFLVGLRTYQHPCSAEAKNEWRYTSTPPCTCKTCKGKRHTLPFSLKVRLPSINLINTRYNITKVRRTAQSAE